MIYQTDIRLLKLIVEKCDRLIGICSKNDLKTIESNFILSDSIQFEFEKIYEDISKISLEFRITHNEINYNALRSIRNRVAHDYESVIIRILYDTVRNDVPVLKETIKSILENDTLN